MRKLFLLLFLFYSHISLSQKKDSKEIYSVSLEYYFAKEPVSLIVIDSTRNGRIHKVDYTGIIIDSAWTLELSKANSKKLRLIKNAVKVRNTPNVFVRLIPRDSVVKAMSAMGYVGFQKEYGVSYRVEFSSIIFLKRKAIVELNFYCGNLCGEDILLFLEKKKGKWKVVFRKRIGIS